MMFDVQAQTIVSALSNNFATLSNFIDKSILIRLLFTSQLSLLSMSAVILN